MVDEKHGRFLKLREVFLMDVLLGGVAASKERDGDFERQPFTPPPTQKKAAENICPGKVSDALRQ